jgi:CRISPR-associated protein Csb2
VWLTRGRRGNPRDDPGINEWRVVVEGFGHAEDFAGSSRLLAASRRWRSVTPFLASGHLKKTGYPGELVRLLRRRGTDTNGVKIREIAEITAGGMRRRALSFHRFRSRGRESRPDSSGALLEIEFPRVVQGPLALGYASHFGLGMFGAR